MTVVISVVGIDGSGKSTQVKNIAKWMEDRGRRATILREPRHFREEIFEAARKIGIESEFTDSYLSYLFGKAGFCDRQEESGIECDVIVRDRDTSVCNYAYHHQMGTPDDLIFLMSWFVNQISCSNIVFWIKVPISTAFQRVLMRKDKPIEQYFEDEEKLKKVSNNYREFMDPYFSKRKLMGLDKTEFIEINGEGTQEEVFNRIKGRLNLLNEKWMWK
jgi:dTMP kinase